MAPAIGIDIGGTRMRAARVSQAGVIEQFHAIATPATTAAVIAAVDSLIATVDHPTVQSIGIGIPGRVETSTGRVFSGGYVDLSPLSVSRNLVNPGARPVFLDNDASMALVAEAGHGAARGIQNVVLLTIGTGIGGAVLADGHIYRGAATAGQLGHVTVDMNGRACLCGRKGCLETVSSGTALRRLMQAAGFADTVSADDLLASGDERARAVLATWAEPLRFGIDSLQAVLDPQLVVLGGGLGSAAIRALAAFPPCSPWFRSPVVAAACGEDAGVIGAAIASRRQLQ